MLTTEHIIKLFLLAHFVARASSWNQNSMGLRVSEWLFSSSGVQKTFLALWWRAEVDTKTCYVVPRAQLRIHEHLLLISIARKCYCSSITSRSALIYLIYIHH